MPEQGSSNGGKKWENVHICLELDKYGEDGKKKREGQAEEDDNFFKGGV